MERTKQKFLDIFCQQGGFSPAAAAILVATVKALKYHGGAKITDIRNPNLHALEKGMSNLLYLTGEILTMPGLPKSPAAEKIDLKPDGTIENVI